MEHENDIKHSNGRESVKKSDKIANKIRGSFQSETRDDFIARHQNETEELSKC